MTQRLTQKTANKATYHGLITPLPGCPDVVVSHAVFRMEGSPAGSGIEANEQRCTQLKEMGYSAVICTVDDTNECQKHILEKNGWQMLCWFDNQRTKHRVLLYFKELM